MRREAIRLGISGWVRNTRDGAVEFEARGSAEALARLVDWCRRGPPAARVRDVEVEPVDGSVDNDDPGFDVRY